MYSNFWELYDIQRVLVPVGSDVDLSMISNIPWGVVYYTGFPPQVDLGVPHLPYYLGGCY